jgi:hypothetical protein
LGDISLGEVRAAVWSYSGRQLWVLDEKTGQGGRRLRLHRIEPYLGVAKLVFEWPRLGVVDDYWLTLDHDGQVLLAASSRARRIHALARLEATPFDGFGPVRASFTFGSKALAAPPIVDGAGYGLMLRIPKDGLVLERRAKFEWQTGKLAKLAQIP